MTGEYPPRGFGLEVSQAVHATFPNETFHPNLEALVTLAAAIGARLPEEPRLLLIRESEEPSTKGVAFLTPPGRGTPLYRRGKNDLVVRLDTSIPEGDWESNTELRQAMISNSIVNVLTEGEQERRRRGKITGIITAIGGLALTTAPEPVPQPSTLLAGVAVGLAGLAIAARYIRKPDPILDLSQFEPPIQLTRDDLA